MKHKIKLAIVFGVEFVAIAVILVLIFFAGKKSYTVTFDLNGGTLLSGDLVQEVIQGGNATPPSAAKDGCYLHSWSASYRQITKDVTIRAVWEYESTVGINYYSEPDSNYCEIIGCFEGLRGDVYIGAYHDGKKVLGIKDGAFAGCTGIKNIYMLDGIVTIGDDVFSGCTSLERIVLPVTLAEIGDGAFAGCTALTEFIAPEALEEIGEGAFTGCTAIEKVELNEGLITIGSCAFSGCISLAEVFIPASVKNIGSDAFVDTELEVYLEIAEADRPDGWVPGWNSGKHTLTWEYTPKPEEGEGDDTPENEAA